LKRAEEVSLAELPKPLRLRFPGMQFCFCVEQYYPHDKLVADSRRGH
jgi:hypothetical protein